ncbi:MAG: TetR/AcrR family transcriptional regulator [Byssovorax sp.]
MQRKAPQQARSRETVAAIVQASTYILVKDGWGHFTTNRVAERAGVNISSLYQYFPNKTAILEAVRESHIEQTRRALLDAVGSGEDPVRAMVRALIEAHRVAPELHRALTEELPHSLRADAECIDHPLLLSVVRGLFASAPDPEIAFFVARSALHAVVHDAACRRPSLLDERRFVAEVEHLARSLTNRRG